MPKQISIRHILAENLRKLRLKNGLSQEKLGDLAGLHRTYVGSVERAERNVSIDSIEALARALKVSVSTLLDEARS
ncbi:MAG: helix-turn-helix transcriptional regulator [Candidatus Acidiferrales bacterium]